MQAEGDDAGFVAIYRSATQAVMVIAVSTAITFGTFPSQILWAWTGDADVASRAASVLSLYALGNGAMVVAAFQHAVQFAKGNLTLHVMGNVVFLIVLLPSLILACRAYGMEGAGWVWLLSNCAMLALWVPLIHKRFLPGLHWDWLCRDVSLPLLSAVGAALVFKVCVDWPSSRLGVTVLLSASALLIVTAAACGSSFARGQVAQRLTRLYAQSIKS